MSKINRVQYRALIDDVINIVSVNSTQNLLTELVDEHHACGAEGVGRRRLLHALL
jgi:hypothetical protein